MSTDSANTQNEKKSTNPKLMLAQSLKLAKILNNKK